VLMITVALAVLVTRGQLNPHVDLTRTEQARLRTRLEEVNLQQRLANWIAAAKTNSELAAVGETRQGRGRGENPRGLETCGRRHVAEHGCAQRLLHEQPRTSRRPTPKHSAAHLVELLLARSHPHRVTEQHPDGSIEQHPGRDRRGAHQHGAIPYPGLRTNAEREVHRAATGATVKQIIDVDGDGRPDTGWIGGSRLFGITTASGATFSTVVKSASPNPPAMLVANIEGTIVALASDQRAAALLLVKNCTLVPAQNAQGSTYYFDLGAGVSGTGVGCSQVAGTQGRSLVGLKLIRDSSGNPQSVERTQIIIDGTQARNGAYDTVPATGPQGAAAAASATQISCGDLTMAADGVHSG